MVWNTLIIGTSWVTTARRLKHVYFYQGIMHWFSYVLNCNFCVLFLCWIRLDSMDKTMSISSGQYPNWICGMQISSNYAGLPAGRRNYSKRVLKSGSRESLELNSKSAVNLQLTYSRYRGTYEAKSRVARCRTTLKRHALHSAGRR